MQRSENVYMDYAWKLIEESGQSVFLTGKAGTGKSTFLRRLSRQTAKKHVKLAPTGIAAINVRGVTIHSFFQVPLGPVLPGDKRLSKIRFNPDKKKLILNMELLIIDEISMVRADLMDALDEILRRVRKSPKPFGGVQLLLVGDLFQLEPVVPSAHRPILEGWYAHHFFFNARVFDELNLINIELEDVYRQEDTHFINLLNGIRHGDFTDYELEELNERCNYQPDEELGFYITLSTTRDKSSRINQLKLASLPGTTFNFQGKIEKDFPLNSIPTDLELNLKENAQVMFVRNDSGLNKRWVNGTLGKIIEIDAESIFVELENGDIHEVEQVSWDNVRYEFDEKEKRIKEQVMGSFIQFPLKLAWAITIHKSQGLTFNEVVIDLGRGAFASGQLYVALSRCTHLGGIYLSKPIHYSDVQVSDEVNDFYRKTNNLHQILDALDSGN